MTDGKGKGILIEERNEDSQPIEDPEEPQQISRDTGKRKAIETAGSDDDQLDEDQEDSQQRRFAGKGKTKVAETGCSSRPSNDDTMTGSSSGRPSNDDRDDNDDEDNIRDLKKLEELDYEFAMKLQAEEYAQAQQQQEANSPIDALPLDARFVDNEDVWVDDGRFLEDPDLDFLDAEDPPPDYIPALKMSPRSWRRHLPVYCICARRILTSSDVDTPGAYLTLDIYGAANLCDNPYMVEDIDARRVNKYILVYDMEDEKYLMLITHYAINETDVNFCISTGWDHFVLNNRLNVGDELNIYKTYDPRVSDDPYFVFKFFRKPQPRPKLNSVGRGKTLPNRRLLDFGKGGGDNGDDDKSDGDKGDHNKDDSDKGDNDKDDCGKGDEGKDGSDKEGDETPEEEGGTYKKLEARADGAGGIVFRFSKNQ